MVIGLFRRDRPDAPFHLSAYVLIGPRVVFAMAKAGQFPAVAARLTRGRGRQRWPPRSRSASHWSCSGRARYESIIVYAGVGLSIFSMLAMSSIYALRWRRPDLPSPFRTPGYPVTPAVYLVIDRDSDVGDVHERPRVSAYALLRVFVAGDSVLLPLANGTMTRVA